MFEKIFNLFSKVNRGISQASQMQSTVDSVMYQKDTLSAAKSKGKAYWIVIVVILIIAVLYIIYG
jgi:hypothetical protein